MPLFAWVYIAISYYVLRVRWKNKQKCIQAILVAYSNTVRAVVNALSRNDSNKTSEFAILKTNTAIKIFVVTLKVTRNEFHISARSFEDIMTFRPELYYFSCSFYPKAKILSRSAYVWEIRTSLFFCWRQKPYKSLGQFWYFVEFLTKALKWKQRSFSLTLLKAFICS